MTLQKYLMSQFTALAIWQLSNSCPFLLTGYRRYYLSNCQNFRKMLKGHLSGQPFYSAFTPLAGIQRSCVGTIRRSRFSAASACLRSESKKKTPILTPFFSCIVSCGKPTSLILIPLFAYIYLKNKHRKVEIIISAAIIFIFFYQTTTVFDP